MVATDQDLLLVRSATNTTDQSPAKAVRIWFCCLVFSVSMVFSITIAWAESGNNSPGELPLPESGARISTSSLSGAGGDSVGDDSDGSVGNDGSEKVLQISLLEALDMANKAHPRVEEAAQELNLAQARLDEVRWAWFTGIKWENYFGAVPVCTEIDRQNGSVICAGEVDVLNPANYRPTFRGGANLGIPLLTFGKLSNGKKLAGAGVEVAEHRMERARRQVGYDVRRAYWAVLLADDLLKIAEEGESRFAEAEKQLRKMEREDSEDFDQKDKLKLGYYRYQITTKVLAARKFKAMAMAALKAAVGVDDPAVQVLPLDDSLEPVKVELADLENYQELALENRPEARELMAGIKARKAELSLAKARLLPDLVLGGGAKYQVTAGADCVIDPAQPSVCINNTYAYPYAALGMVWNFNLPQTRSKIKQAEAQLAKLEAEGKKGLLGLRLEVEETWRNVKEKQAVVDAVNEGVKSARRWIISNTMDYEMGVASLKDLVDAIVAHSQARVEYNQAIYDLNVGVAALWRDVGTNGAHLNTP